VRKDDRRAEQHEQSPDPNVIRFPVEASPVLDQLDGSVSARDERQQNPNLNKPTESLLNL
jgi:hypothetical protein